MQVTLAVLAAVTGLVQWVIGEGVSWLVGAAFIVSVIPFTVVAILPTNKRLLEPGRDNTSAETRRLLEAWGHLHAVRSVVSLVATLIYLYAFAGA